MSTYVYRAPVERPARPNANGNFNVVGAAKSRLGFMGAAGREAGVDNVRYLQHPFACPAWGCDGPPRELRIYDWGGRATTPQPPPGSLPVGGPVVQNSMPTAAGGPSPVVAADPSNFGPSQGLTLDAQSSVPASGIMGFLTGSTLISSFPNWAVLGAGLVAYKMFFGGKR